MQASASLYARLALEPLRKASPRACLYARLALEPRRAFLCTSPKPQTLSVGGAAREFQPDGVGMKQGGGPAGAEARAGGGPLGACARACFASGCPKLPADAVIVGTCFRASRERERERARARERERDREREHVCVHTSTRLTSVQWIRPLAAAYEFQFQVKSDTRHTHTRGAICWPTTAHNGL